MQNLYDILEVSSKASKEIIEKAYKVLVKKYHPDLQQTDEGKKDAEEKIKQINEAYEILGNEEKRATYDAELEQKRSEEEQRENAQNENQNNYYAQERNIYQNNTNNKSYNIENENNNTYNQEEPNNDNFQDNVETWKEQFAKLNPIEQRKLKKKIEKNAQNEYMQMYEDYFRSMGYRVKHKLTWKEIRTIIIAIAIIVIIFYISWLIPPARQWMINLYNTNILVKILVDIIKGIGLRNL